MQRQTNVVACEKKSADIVSVDKVLALRLVWINIPRKRARDRAVIFDEQRDTTKNPFLKWKRKVLQIMPALYNV